MWTGKKFIIWEGNNYDKPGKDKVNVRHGKNSERDRMRRKFKISSETLVRRSFLPSG